MWSSIIPTAPEGISVDDFFTNFVPEQFSQMKEILNAVDLSFLAGKDFNMLFNVEGKEYGIKFKNGNDLEIINGAVDKPAVAFYVSEKDWRDAVTGKFNKMADDFSGDRARDFASCVPAHAVRDESEITQFSFGTSFRRGDKNDCVLVGRADASNVCAHCADHAQPLHLAVTLRDCH